jgi:hypothetical protein
MRSTTSRPTYSACDASDASCSIFLHLVIHWRLPGMDALNVLGRLKVGGINLHMIEVGGDVTGNGVSKLVFTIPSAVAEAERDRTRSARVQVGTGSALRWTLERRSRRARVTTARLWSRSVCDGC